MQRPTRKRSAQLQVGSLPWARKIIEEHARGAPDHSGATLRMAERIVLEALSSTHTRASGDELPRP